MTTSPPKTIEENANTYINEIKLFNYHQHFMALQCRQTTYHLKNIIC